MNELIKHCFYLLDGHVKLMCPNLSQSGGLWHGQWSLEGTILWYQELVSSDIDLPLTTEDVTALMKRFYVQWLSVTDLVALWGQIYIIFCQLDIIDEQSKQRIYYPMNNANRPSQ
jgi:hypothetical protein